MENKEVDTRPVRCFICKKKMYYSGHAKHEPEYQISDDQTHGYVHASCVNKLKEDALEKEGEQ